MQAKKGFEHKAAVNMAYKHHARVKKAFGILGSGLASKPICPAYFPRKWILGILTFFSNSVRIWHPYTFKAKCLQQVHIKQSMWTRGQLSDLMDLLKAKKAEGLYQPIRRFP